MLRALRFCKHPGCSELVADSYCPEHKAEHEQLQAEENKRYSQQRGSAASQGYDAQWQKVRLVYLRQHPLCEQCLEEGNTVPASMVHHVKAIKDGGARLDTKNLKALCNEHHEKIHGKDRWRKK